MRNDIASFEKTRSSEVKFWAKFDAKINSRLIFSIILTLPQLVFSKEAILFLIYLRADKINYDKFLARFIILRFECIYPALLPWGSMCTSQSPPAKK